MDFDQFRKLGADGVDDGVQGVNREPCDGLAVFVFQNGLQFVEAGFRFCQHGLNGGDQLLFLFNQIGGFVSRPGFVDARAGVFEVFAGLFPLDVAVANLVRHVHDVHSVKISDHFQVTQGHHPVFVNGAQTVDRLRHALETCQSHNDGHQGQKPDQQEEANVDAEVVHEQIGNGDRTDRTTGVHSRARDSSRVRHHNHDGAKIFVIDSFIGIYAKSAHCLL